MVKVIANNLIDSPELLKNCLYLGYAFSTKHSSNNELVFIKSQNSRGEIPIEILQVINFN